MTEAIIVALITASATVICQLIINTKARKDQDAKQAARDQEVEDRLKGIERRLDAHNHYAEKLGDIAIALTAIKKDIEYIRGEK